MPNICAVRTLLTRPEAFAFRKKDWFLPHEPTVVTEEIRAAALEGLEELGLGPESAMGVGEEMRQGPYHMCRHCKCLYGEGQ